MNVHVTNKTNKSCKVVCYIVKKIRQLLDEHRVSKIVLLVK